jgi:succinate-semialdehyde dehydrogenase/glutarate-semialdehyde dehydrogenase
MSQLLIKGQWVDGESTQTLTEKFRGRFYGQMAVASAAQVDEAVTGALAGVHASSLSPYERFQILAQAARLTEGRMAVLSGLMRDEAGFTKPDADNEVRRCVQTLELSADEA